MRQSGWDSSMANPLSKLSSASSSRPSESECFLGENESWVVHGWQTGLWSRRPGRLQNLPIPRRRLMTSTRWTGGSPLRWIAAFGSGASHRQRKEQVCPSDQLSPVWTPRHHQFASSSFLSSSQSFWRSFVSSSTSCRCFRARRAASTCRTCFREGCEAPL